MPDIYAYTDYRAYLRDAYLEKKRSRPSGFTHRFIGRKGGFDPGLFSKVIQGQRNISPKLIPRFCAAFGLYGPEAAFFECLVLMQQARSDLQREIRQDQLSLLRNRHLQIAQSYAYPRMACHT